MKKRIILAGLLSLVSVSLMNAVLTQKSKNNAATYFGQLGERVLGEIPYPHTNGYVAIGTRGDQLQAVRFTNNGIIQNTVPLNHWFVQAMGQPISAVITINANHTINAMVLGSTGETTSYANIEI